MHAYNIAILRFISPNFGNLWSPPPPVLPGAPLPLGGLGRAPGGGRVPDAPPGRPDPDRPVPLRPGHRVRRGGGVPRGGQAGAGGGQEAPPEAAQEDQEDAAERNQVGKMAKFDRNSFF